MIKKVLLIIISFYIPSYAAVMVDEGFEDVNFAEGINLIEYPKIAGWNISGTYWNIYREQANEIEIVQGRNALYLFSGKAVREIGKIRVEKIYNIDLFVAANDVQSANNSFVILECDKGNQTFAAVESIRLSEVIKEQNLKHFEKVSLKFNAAERTDLRGYALRIVLVSGGMVHFDDVKLSEENNTKDTLILENEHVKYVFEGKYKSIASMFDKKAGIEHINLVSGQGFYDKPLPAGLWQMTFECGDKTETLSSTDLPCSSAVIQEKPNTKTAIINWKDVSLIDSPNSVDITVRVELASDNGIAKWNISVDNNSCWGISDIKFPYIRGLLKQGQYDISLPRKNIGMMYKKCTERLFCEYGEGWWMPAQFIIADVNSACVYMAAYDGKGRPKNFVCDPGKEFYIQSYAENTGIAGNDFISPYSFELGVYQGNWIDGCKIYRQFALNNADWTKNGKLANNKNVTDKIKNVDVWINVGDYQKANADVDEKNKSIKDFKAEFNSNVGVHWYRWHDNAFDNQLPHYLPPKPAIAEQIRDLAHDSNYLIMPYINARVVSYDINDINYYMPLLCRDKNGKPYEELYGPAPKTYVVCPYTEKWQNYIYDLTKTIVQELGVNAIYLDQVAGAPIKLCYDKTHGHPIGGGSWWVEGYRKMLSRLRTIKDKNGNPITITVEFAAEPYMDMADDFLIWMQRAPNDLPMLPMVYSGYTLYFGSNCYFPEDKAWKIVQARCLLWGVQNGWMAPEYILDEKQTARKEFFKKVIAMRKKAKEYLVYGELVDLIDSGKKIDLKWNNENTSYPAIQAAVWNLNNKIAIIAANYSDVKEKFSASLPLGKYNLKMAAHSTDYEYDSISNTITISKEIDQEELVLIELPTEK
jgi:hypothetical protein